MNRWSGRLSKSPLQLLGVGLLALLLVSLMLASLTSAEPVATTISITVNTPQVKIGDVITYHFSLVNTGVQTEVIFYAPIPQGVTFSAVEGATPQTYTIGLRTTDEIRSISWAGMLSSTYLITLSIVVAGPGEQANGDILVEGNLIDPASGVNFYRASHLTDYLWPYERYLPLIASGVGGSVITPTPTTTPPPSGTPTPMPSILEINGVMGTYERLAPIYDNALNADFTGPGGNVAYQYNIWPNYLEVGQWGIHEIGFSEHFRLFRGFIEFDTTQIQTQPTTATLYLQIGNKPVGLILPQVIHEGTWEGYLRNESEIGLRWKDFEDTELTRYLETDSTSQTLNLSLPLPPSGVVLGDVTHLLIRSGEEGTPPPTGDPDNCFECKRLIRYTAIKLILEW